MTIGQIKEATCAPATCAERFLQSINDTCARYGLDRPARQLSFLAQVGHESGGLFYTEELASGNAYEGRANLGNTVAGDGVRFKGRGLIQITGRNNYGRIAAALGIDCINKPELLGGKNVKMCTQEQLNNAALTAGWYWNSCNLNALADKINLAQPIDEGNNLVQFKAITKAINGGYNGLADRVNRYKIGSKYF
jgi:putative chitinase